MNQTASPVAVARKGRGGRECLSCGQHIHNGKPAVRVSEDSSMQTGSYRLRFWLCRNCADVIEATLEKRRAS